jgi:hypothetical protein
MDSGDAQAPDSAPHPARGIGGRDAPEQTDPAQDHPGPIPDERDEQIAERVRYRLSVDASYQAPEARSSSIASFSQSSARGARLDHVECQTRSLACSYQVFLDYDQPEGRPIMDQAKLFRPAPPWPDSVLADAKYESWLSEAHDFATPGEAGFVQALDSLRPGPLLCAVIEKSVNDLSRHSAAELAAVLRACERLITYARYRQFLVISELARRGLAASVDVA